MRRMSLLLLAAMAAVLVMPTMPVNAASGDVLVTNGSPTTPFAENKQNEPAVAVNAHHPNVVAAGANEEIDMEACNAGTDNSCPFTPGIGVSGVYFSFNSGQSWTQPTYTGLTARNCQGVVGDSDPYYEAGLVSDGDPALAFGPRKGGPNAPVPGQFSWSNGSRLYYANLTSNLGATRSEATFKGFEAIAVSRTDHVASAAAGNNSAWKAPVIISHQSQTTFSDKEQIWADNASSSQFFGTVYVCWASFKGQEKSPNAAPAPLEVAVSHDGGTTWTQHPISAAANNRQRNPSDGCTIRTDSNGTAYVFGVGTSSSGGHQAFELMSRSFNGGQTWSSPRPVVGPVTQPGAFDPVQGRPVIDGVAGARSDLAPAPSVDIANGAPTGSDATDRIVMSYVSGDLADPHVKFAESTNGGNSWSTPRNIESTGDRGFYAAPAISPNGTDVYVVYDAFQTPFQPTTATPRSMQGVVLHATSPTNTGPTGAFSEIHRGAAGDPRGSSANALTDEFLGDYVYAAATRGYGVAVWNDVRNAADCSAVDAWRQSLQDGNFSATPPAPEQDCPATFGNSDIYAFTSI